MSFIGSALSKSKILISKVLILLLQRDTAAISQGTNLKN